MRRPDLHAKGIEIFLRRLSAAVVLLGAAAGCGGSPGGPEPIRPAEDVCGECRMQIIQPRFAAQVLEPGGFAIKFDDIGCLMTWLGKDPSRSARNAWVADCLSGTWIEARSAVYARTEEKTPMGSGILAFETREAAAARGAPRGFEDLLAKEVAR
jgi:copper chaperone NosL